MGLSGTPGPGQPTRPAAVDRVLVDGTDTYVLFHIDGTRGVGDFPTFDLYDDRGARITGSGGSGFLSRPQARWTVPFPLPSWVRWHPPTVERGYVIVNAVPPLSAHALTLKIQMPRSGVTVVETVRVPLNLRALARRVAHPGTTVRVAGLTLTLRDVDATHLTYTYTLPPNSSASSSFFQLTDHAGHAVAVTPLVAPCVKDRGSGGMNCTASVAFSPQPPSARLTLTIPTFLVSVYNAQTPGSHRLLAGPWRLPFSVP